MYNQQQTLYNSPPSSTGSSGQFKKEMSLPNLLNKSSSDSIPPSQPNKFIKSQPEPYNNNFGSNPASTNNLPNCRNETYVALPPLNSNMLTDPYRQNSYQQPMNSLSAPQVYMQVPIPSNSYMQQSQYTQHSYPHPSQPIVSYGQPQQLRSYQQTQPNQPPCGYPPQYPDQRYYQPLQQQQPQQIFYRNQVTPIYTQNQGIYQTQIFQHQQAVGSQISTLEGSSSYNKTTNVELNIRKTTINTTNTTLEGEMPKSEDISVITPIPGCMAYHHPLIPVIPSASGNRRKNLHSTEEVNKKEDQQNGEVKSEAIQLSGTSSSSPNNTADLVRVDVTKGEKNEMRRMAFGSPTWSAKDDELLRYLKETEKIGWRDISMYFPTRTINACQFRWRRLIMREENKRKRELHKKAIKERLLLNDLTVHSAQIHAENNKSASIPDAVNEENIIRNES